MRVSGRGGGRDGVKIQYLSNSRCDAIMFVLESGATVRLTQGPSPPWLTPNGEQLSLSIGVEPSTVTYDCSPARKYIYNDEEFMVMQHRVCLRAWWSVVALVRDTVDERQRHYRKTTAKEGRHSP